MEWIQINKKWIIIIMNINITKNNNNSDDFTMRDDVIEVQFAVSSSPKQCS